MNEANCNINNQLKNILNYINKNNTKENLNKNINNLNLIKEDKENKNDAKYKKIYIPKYSTININGEKTNIRNDNKNIVVDNPGLLNKYQHNNIKNEKEIDKEAETETEREREKGRDELDFESANIIYQKNKKMPFKIIRRNNTNQEDFNKKPINIKTPDNMSFNRKINNKNNEINEGFSTKFLNTNIDTKDKNANKIYQSINNLFFYDYQQKYIKDKKINEYQKEELKKQLFNDKINGRNILKEYYMNYIEKIILPLFKKSDAQSKLDIIKYNISIILECLGMDKNYYNNFELQNSPKVSKYSRCQSKEALIRFRKEFNISKEDYTDEAIENQLIENDLDINKTFRKMFG